MSLAMPLNKTVPITAFNRGKAGQIFSEVKKTGMTVVMKNNEPECVLLSPAQYEALLDAQCDADLYTIAEKRLQSLTPNDTISFDDVCHGAGITRDELERMDEVELE